jgi:hypothetical protein
VWCYPTLEDKLYTSVGISSSVNFENGDLTSTLIGSGAGSVAILRVPVQGPPGGAAVFQWRIKIGQKDTMGLCYATPEKDASAKDCAEFVKN